MLQELLADFTDQTPAKQAAAKVIIDKAVKGRKWIPSPGPQTDAYFCKADVLLYGGAGGGGKTDLGIGLAITKHLRSLIMRRKYTDLAFLTDRSIEIWGTKKGFNGSAPPRFDLNKDQLIEYGAAQTVGDELSWMGRPHDLLCLEIGSKILLPNGDYCPIEKLRVGNLVMTLEGPKPVERIFDRGFDKAVLATAYCDNTPLFQQVQGYGHSLLTNEGWVSHDNEPGIHSSLIERPLSRSCHYSYNDDLLMCNLSQEFRQLLFEKRLDWKRIPIFFQSFYHQLQRVFSVFSNSKLQEIYSVLFGRQHVIFWRQLLEYSRLRRQELDLCPILPLPVHELSDHVVCDAQTKTLLGGFLESCLSLFHQRDEHARPIPNDGLFYFPQLNGVERQNPTRFEGDALDKTQKHILHKESYVHPYTKEKRPIDTSFVSLPLSFTPVGKKHLYDITVKDTNHYVSYNGFVNKNCIDEAAHFAESQIRALMGWVRTTVDGQRVRVVFGSNPPLSDEGAWIFKMFGPWLDPAFPNPAKPGELRWCVVNDEDRDIWVDGPGDHELSGKMVRAMSRTFIPAKLKDNPFQDTPEYRAQQDGLPKHLRDAIRDGNFLAVRKDHALQVIPTAWIQAAMDRWKSNPPRDVPMCAIGVDVAQGGTDNSSLAMRYDGWFDRLVVVPGKETPLGKDVAALVIKHRRDGAKPVIDMGGGYGGSTYEHLLNNDIRPIQYKGAGKSMARTKNSKIPFHNKRAEAYYKFMEDLDPGQQGGSKITLPPDEFLRADLCSIRFDDTNSDINLIKLEPKKKLIARIGRSTDYSDPVVMAWTSGGKMASHYKQWHNNRRAPKVIRKR